MPNRHGRRSGSCDQTPLNRMACSSPIEKLESETRALLHRKSPNGTTRKVSLLPVPGGIGQQILSFATPRPRRNRATETSGPLSVHTCTWASIKMTDPNVPSVSGHGFAETSVHLQSQDRKGHARRRIGKGVPDEAWKPAVTHVHNAKTRKGPEEGMPYEA